MKQQTGSRALPSHRGPSFAFFLHASLFLQEALEEVRQKEAENKAGGGSFGNHFERKVEEWDNKEEAVFGQLVRVNRSSWHPSFCILQHRH